MLCVSEVELKSGHTPDARKTCDILQETIFFLDNYKAKGISACYLLNKCILLAREQASVTSTLASFKFDCEIPISVFLNANTVREQYLSQRNLLWILIQSKFLLFQRGTFPFTLVLSFALT